MRTRTKGRVNGPYPDRRGWRVVVVARDGTRTSSVLASEAEARAVVDELRRQLALEEVTVAQAIEMYATHLAERGRRESSIRRAENHLRMVLADPDAMLADIGPAQAAALYADARARKCARTNRPYSVDTHRNALTECGMFARWALRRKLIGSDPFADVEPIGKRKRGKPQLRLDEARKLLDVTVPAAEEGDRGALCVTLLLLTGLRASEAAHLGTRDVDDSGRLLWVSTSKTEAGLRRLAVPDPLVGPLAAAAKGGGAVFPVESRFWVRRQVTAWCRRAGVPVVPPHGLRGTHSTLAQEHGATSHLVAAALGHADDGQTAERHYTAPGAAQTAQARRAWKVLAGGRS
jgi:integrase/recombinase XerC